MNKELLFQLYSIHSPSGREKKMRKFVKRYIRRHCGYCEIEQDIYGNVFITKGYADSYPCLAAHLDQVQDDHSKDFEVLEGKDVVFGYSAKARQQQGLGADDKNGIWIALECLREFSELKVVFFVGEEVGCQGSGKCDLKFFSDCRYIIEPDRMNGHDLITSMMCGAVCSKEFVEALGADMYGYKEARGSITDVGELVERGVGISCLNVSCGYYCAHTDEEFTVLSELQNCLDFVCHIIDTLTDKVYPFEYVEYDYVYDRYYGHNYGHNYGNSYYNGRSGGYYYQNNNVRSLVSGSKPKVSVVVDDDADYYDMYYEDDYEMMTYILESNPELTFDEIVGTGGWIGNFNTRDMGVLKEIYDEVCQYYGYGSSSLLDSGTFMDEEVDDDCDEEDNDTIGELSFEDVNLRKVS